MCDAAMRVSYEGHCRAVACSCLVTEASSWRQQLQVRLACALRMRTYCGLPADATHAMLRRVGFSGHHLVLLILLASNVVSDAMLR